MKSWLLLLSALALVTTPALAARRSCSLFPKARGPLEVRVIFGYKDSRPARFVGDRHERIAFISKITAPCEGANFACGFTRDADDAESFVKILVSDGQLRTVHALVVNSSVGSDDQENRGDNYQVAKSAHSEEVFLSGLKTADVVLYNGHSRFGSGPDFHPPRLRKDGRVDVASYKANPASFSQMLASLRETPDSPLQLLGLYSCASTQHFESAIHYASKTKIVSSRELIYYADALTDSLETLNEVLHGNCAKSF